MSGGVCGILRVLRTSRLRLGYNHACECRPITRADVDRVKAVPHSNKLLGFAKL